MIKRLLLRARVPFTECGTELEIVSRIFQHLPVFIRFVGILFFRNKGPLRYALDARKEDRRKGTPILAGGASQKVPKRAFSRVDETYRKAQKVMGLFTRRRAGVTFGVCANRGGVNARSTLAEKRHSRAKCDNSRGHSASRPQGCWLHAPTETPRVATARATCLITHTSPSGLGTLRKSQNHKSQAPTRVSSLYSQRQLISPLAGALHDSRRQAAGEGFWFPCFVVLLNTYSSNVLTVFFTTFLQNIRIWCFFEFVLEQMRSFLNFCTF